MSQQNTLCSVLPLFSSSSFALTCSFDLTMRGGWHCVGNPGYCLLRQVSLNTYIQTLGNARES